MKELKVKDLNLKTQWSYHPNFVLNSVSYSTWLYVTIALYKLFQSLKYWRFRVYILPVSSSMTKKSGEGSEYCDHCTPLSFEEQTHLSETFLRFIETWINKIRRPPQKKSRVCLVGLCSRKEHDGQLFCSGGYQNISSLIIVSRFPKPQPSLLSH